MKVWIAQLKCPSNHTVVAMAGEISGDNSDTLVASLRAGFDEMVERKMLNRECGICKSTTLHIEVKRTKFDSLAEAKPALAESERQQLATAEFLKQSKN